MFGLFPSPTLTAYMARTFLIRSFAFLLILTLVLQVLDLLGESGHILAYPGNGSPEIWRYVGLRLPQLAARFLPFSVLLGTLATFFTLNQNSEIVAMKAAGLSPHQILGPAMLAGLLVAGASFAFNETVVTGATAELYRWDNAHYGPVPHARGATNVWAKQGENLVHADTAMGKGAQTRLEAVTIYLRAHGQLLQLIRATSAQPQGDGWVLMGARKFDVASGVDTPLGTVVAARGISPDQFVLAEVNADRTAIGALTPAIRDLRAANRPTTALEAGWWHKLSSPLSSILMPLLGSVAAFGLARSGRLFIRAVTGMALGFAYFVSDNAALAMGNIGVYPPLLAAFGPFLLFALIGELVLVRTEE